MASNRLSYHRLQKLSEVYTEEEEDEAVVLSSRSRSWLRLRRISQSSNPRRWRRPRLRIPGLRRLLQRKVRVMGAAVRVSVGKVLKRLKEGRSHVGELFAGNYMFMQVSPSPTKLGSLEKSFLARYQQYYLQHYHHGIIPPPSTRFNMPRVAS